jgi:hypothetical protein
MFASNRCSLSNPTEVFNRDCLARYGSFLDQLLADAVVGVFLETCFALSHAANAALGVACAALLQPLAAQVIAFTDEVDNLAGEMFSFAVGREVNDAQVNPQRSALWLSLIGSSAALRDVQVVRPGSPDQVSPANFPCWVY